MVMNYEREKKFNPKKLGLGVAAGIGISVALISPDLNKGNNPVNAPDTNSSNNENVISNAKHELITFGMEPRRENGQWNDEQIAEMANSMESREGYPFIQKGGQTLNK